MNMYAELDAKPHLAHVYQTYAAVISEKNDKDDSEAQMYLRKAAALYRELKLTDKARECEKIAGT
jgi:predicted secreted Zn-dependent protease